MCFQPSGSGYGRARAGRHGGGWVRRPGHRLSGWDAPVGLPEDRTGCRPRCPAQRLRQVQRSLRAAGCTPTDCRAAAGGPPPSAGRRCLRWFRWQLMNEPLTNRVRCPVSRTGVHLRLCWWGGGRLNGPVNCVAGDRPSKPPVPAPAPEAEARAAEWMAPSLTAVGLASGPVSQVITGHPPLPLGRRLAASIRGWGIGRACHASRRPSTA